MSDLSKLKAEAKAAHLSGDFKKAIESQIAVVNHFAKEGGSKEETKLLSLYLYSAGDYPSALQMTETLRDLDPDDAETHANLGVILRKMNKIPEAIIPLEKSVELDPDRSNTHDALAHNYGQLRNVEKCREHGNRSLELKDRDACERVGKVYAIPSQPPKAFQHGGNNVISFSLWGKNPRYLTGAIRNAELIPDIYPGWTMVVYHDSSVPHPPVCRILPWS
ncbi:MAG: tetratricopeptide repeat protein, partial [Verrucomicrobiota bacterium]